jgi:hypothetical protein
VRCSAPIPVAPAEPAQYHAEALPREDHLTAEPQRPTASRAARLAALAAALLALAGCARDLDLPPEAAGPRLTGLAPAQAYAGELVEVLGAGFADDPTANRVDFARASAQGVARTGGGLLVRVPADAGSGPVTVTTSRGASQPLAGFAYRGLGQLRAGQVVQAVPLLHQPRALFATGPDPVVDSTLFRGLVGTGQLPFAVPRSFQRPVAGGGLLYLVDPDRRLVAWLPGSGEQASAALAVSPTAVGYAGSPTGALALTITAGAAGDVLATFDALTLDPGPCAGPLGVKVQSDPVDAGDGHFVVVAEDAASAFTLALVDVRGAVPAVTLLPAPAVAIQGSPVALAAGLVDGARLVAVALSGGQVALASLDGAPAWRPFRIRTFAETAVAALAIAGGRVLAAKADDGVVLGLDPAATLDPLLPGVAWAVALPRPTALAVGPGGEAWAAGDADNVLSALDPGRGVLLGRRAADPGATAASLQAGAAWRPADEAPGAALAFPVARPAALVHWPIGGDPEALLQPLAPALVAWDRWRHGFWIGDAGAVAFEGGAPLLVAGGVEALAPSPAGLVALGGDLSLVQGAALRPIAADLDTPIVLPARSEDGRLLAVGSMGGAERARLWSAAALEAAAAPTLDVVLPGPALQGAFVDGEPWVTWLDPDTFESRSARLGPEGVLLDGVAGQVPDGLRSPNGRTVVVAEPGLLGGGLTALRVVALEPQAGFPTIDRIELPAPVVGLAFDDAGERLFVVTRTPDQLLALE